MFQVIYLDIDPSLQEILGLESPLSLSDILDQVTSEIVHSLSQIISRPQNGIIQVSFISDDRIRELNAAYRQIDRTTDVLSFHYFEDFTHTGASEVAGEIILSPSLVLSQSKERGHSICEESLRLTIHGILHILGYNHESDDEYQSMWEIERELIKIAKDHDLLQNEKT